jgi:hypothetical protein
MNNLQCWAKEKINKYPNLEDEINDFIQLCIDEVEQGASLTHEIELCQDSIEQLINEEEN